MPVQNLTSSISITSFLASLFGFNDGSKVQHYMSSRERLAGEKLKIKTGRSTWERDDWPVIGHY